MQHRGVVATADDGRVGLFPGAAPGAFMDKVRFQLVFHHARFAVGHDALVGRRGNFCRLAHEGNLGAGLVQAHVVQVVIQGDEFLGRVHAAARLAPQLVHPVGHLLVQFGIAAHGVEHPLALFQHARQDVIEVADGKGVIGVVVFHRPFLPGDGAVPAFLLLVPFPAEQDVFALLAAGDEYCNGFRFRETGQIVEVAVRAVGIMHVIVALSDSGGGKYGDAVLAHHAHELAPPPLEFSPCHFAPPRAR